MGMATADDWEETVEPTLARDVEDPPVNLRRMQTRAMPSMTNTTATAAPTKAITAPRSTEPDPPLPASAGQVMQCHVTASRQA